MRFIRLVTTQLKQSFKDWKGLLLMIGLPVGICLVTYFMSSSTDATLGSLMVINEDQGESGSKMIADHDNEMLTISFMDSLDDAMNELEAANVDAVYVIPEDFSQNLASGQIPQIEYYQQEGEQYTSVILLNDYIGQYIENLLKHQLYYENGLDYNQIMSVQLMDIDVIVKESNFDEGILFPILILYFMFMTSDGIARELFRLRNNKVLRRLLSTDNSDVSIILSFITSKFIFQVSLSVLSFLLLNQMMGMGVARLGHFVLSLVLMSLISICLSVLAVRVVKNEGMLSMCTSVLSIVLFFGGFIGIMKDVVTGIPAVVYTIVQFSPFHWAYDMVIDGNIWPNTIVLLLMAIILATVGSYKLRNFVNS